MFFKYYLFTANHISILSEKKCIKNACGLGSDRPELET